jgi:ubiquinone/menaquinone biosynthesis C-methylase UbiE
MNEIAEKQYWDSVNNAGEIKRLANHTVVEFFSNQRINYMRKFIDLDKINIALDVGCGTGFSSHNISQITHLTSLDFSLRLLKLNPSPNKIQASAYHLPFKSDTFDLVYGWDFLHHLHDPVSTVKEMARVSKKYLILFEPNKNNPIQFLYAYSNKNERGTLNFDKQKMLNFLKSIDFQLISCEYVGWIFAGATPKLLLNMVKHFPFQHSLGISVVLICKKY